MALSDLSELIAEASRISKRGDLASYAGMLLGFLETDLNETVRHRGMMASASLTTDASGSVALPTDYLEAASVTYGSNAEIHLSRITREMFDVSVSGYLIEGGNLISSEAGTEHTLRYYQQIPSIWANNTNWLFASHPDVYLRGLVCEAHKDAGDVEAAVAANALYEMAKERLIGNDLRARRADTVSLPRTQI